MAMSTTTNGGSQPMAYMGFKALATAKGPGLAAYIGRKKYGADKFNKAAASGTTLRNDPINKTAARPPLGNSRRFKDAVSALSGKDKV